MGNRCTYGKCVVHRKGNPAFSLYIEEELAVALVVRRSRPARRLPSRRLTPKKGVDPTPGTAPFFGGGVGIMAA